MTKRTTWTWRAGAAGGLLLLAGAASAANPAYLHIDVTIAANLSVSVNGVASSTDTSATWNTATPNAKLVDLSSATVTNDSGGTTEKWLLATNANSIDTGGASPGSWALQTTTTTVPGPDQFAVQAVFADSTSLTNNGTPNPDAGNKMVAGGKRALCWRVITPSSTATSDTQNIQVIVSASL